MKVSTEESEVRATQIEAPFRRIVKLLASPQEGMELPRHSGSVLGVLRTKKLTVGITEIPPGGGLAPHIHEDTEEIIYPLSGTAEYIIDGKNTVTRPGTILLIPPKIRHEAKNNSEGLLKQIWCTG